MMINLC